MKQKQKDTANSILINICAFSHLLQRSFAQGALKKVNLLTMILVLFTLKFMHGKFRVEESMQ